MKNPLHRVILVSDMHYTTEETHEEMLLSNPQVNTSAAAGDAFGHTQKEKVQCIVKDITSFTDNNPTDAVLVLGDLSIDDYGFRNLPDNYCTKFKEDCMEKLACPSYAIAGNHDSYPEEMWKEIFGYGRQYSLKIGNAVFVMLDTFKAAAANSASGSPYVGIDVDYLRKELAKYPTEPIFLCTHHIKDEPKEELMQLLSENPRIVCLFRGHTHINQVLQCQNLAGKPLVDIGGYGYVGEVIDGNWHFDRFDPSWAWGFEVLEWNEDEAFMYHIKPARTYRGFNGVFELEEMIEGERSCALEK